MLQASSGDGRTLTDEALNALRDSNAHDLEAAAACQTSANALRREYETDDAGIPLDPQARERYISLHREAFSRLFALACGEELLWYECNARDAGQETAVSDICKALRGFVNRVDMLTGPHLVIGAHSVPGWLYTEVPSDRLVFVLLLQLLLLWQRDLTLNSLEFFAKKEADEIRIEMNLRRDPAADTEPLPQEFAGLTEEAAAPMTERFCREFQASCLCRTANGGQSCSLRLPAAGILQQQVEVHSDGIRSINGGRNACHALLSRLIPTETLLWGDALTD